MDADRGGRGRRAVAAAQASLTLIDAARAARALAGIERFDPVGAMRPEGVEALCQAGECFELSGQVHAVFVVRLVDGIAFVDAAQGSGDADVTEVLDAILTRQAQGLRAIALQTMRPGLVRKLQRRGYRVAGWILKKDM